MNKLRLILLLLLTLLCCLSACKSAEPAQQPLDAEVNETSPADPDGLVRLNLATGATSGNYYPFGSALSQVVDDATGYIRLDVNATTASAENIELLSSGAAQLAIVQNDILNYAFHGVNMWEGKTPVTNVNALMTLYPEICQLIVAADSGIESVADLADKRVAVGEEGSAVSVDALQIFAAAELNMEDIDMRYIGFAAAAEAMKAKTIDAFFVTVGTPNKGVMDLQAECNIRIINLDDALIEALLEKFPFYTRVTLNENDYSFLTEPVGTVAVRATLAAVAALDEQVAYDIVKAIIENKDKLAVAHAKGLFIDAAAAVSGLSVELHPGARRYFKEIGVL